MIQKWAGMSDQSDDCDYFIKVIFISLFYDHANCSFFRGKILLPEN